jgi:hypothetical protein
MPAALGEAASTKNLTGAMAHRRAAKLRQRKGRRRRKALPRDWDAAIVQLTRAKRPKIRNLESLGCICQAERHPHGGHELPHIELTY